MRWLALVCASESRVRAYLNRVVHSEDEVRELMAETTANAWIARNEMLEASDPGLALLAQARLACRKWMAAHRREIPLTDSMTMCLTADTPSGSGDSAQELDVQFDWLRRVMDQLPAPYRLAVEFRFCLRARYSTIAAVLGCSEGAARVRVSRGWHRLLAIVANETAPSALDPEE